MRSIVLARRRALNVCVGFAAVMSIAAGCTTASTVSVEGSTLTLYASAPRGAANTQAAADVLAAEQLAFKQSGTKLGKFTLRFIKLGGAKASDNARSAIEDTSSIAYLGELDPGLSADSLGITNAQDLLQVTPTDTAAALTQPTPSVPNSPNRYYESLGNFGRTFARVVPTTSLEAKAQVQEMQALHVSRLYVSSDGSQYGRAIAQAVRTDAPTSSITIAPSSSGADAIFYGAVSEDAAARVFNAAASSSPAVKLFGPSALDATTFAARLSPAARHVYISSPGFMTKDLSATAKSEFLKPFEDTYHRAPSPQAIFGYEAMSAILAVLKKAGTSVTDRATVVQDFFAIRNRDSVLGTYSINAQGDTSLAPFVFSRPVNGKLVPFQSVQVQG
ncbi:MAG TPA: ABC transporter substrate-binding protein [Solirubrobacteraceae bacterium]|nr:ABC transporter substrate-binding protein [Solirubrobacteraceae bacterium]